NRLASRVATPLRAGGSAPMPRAPRFPAYPAKSHSTGQARIRIAGKDYYLGVHGSEGSRQEYARLAAEFAAGTLGQAPPRPRSKRGGTVDDVIAAWLVASEAERGDTKERTEIKRALLVLSRVH